MKTRTGDILCDRSRCRRAAECYTMSIPVAVPHEHGFVTQVAGGGGMKMIIDFCQRHAFRCKYRLDPPPPGAPK